MKWRHSSRSPTYYSWIAMHARCYNEHCNRYETHGKRGIIVCERWFNYDNFVDDMGEKPEGTTLERSDNDGPYELVNCVWATPAQQARNRRNNTILTHNGRSMCIVEWAEELGIRPGTLRQRLHKGWSIERALTP